MKQIDQELDAAVRNIALSVEEIAQRQAFLEISDRDVELLQQIHVPLKQEQQNFIESFCSHLLQFPSMHTLLSGAGTIERLKQTQSSYFNRLTSGEYGPDYVEHRLRVGLVHQRISLEPQWYIGAYRKYMSDLMPAIWDLLEEDPENFLRTFDAFLKIVCFDMCLALDAYKYAEQQEIRHLKHYSEKIIDSMPSGLMVIDVDRTIRTINLAMKKMFRIGIENKIDDTPLFTNWQNQSLKECIEQALCTSSYRHNLLITVPSATDGTRHLQCNISRTVVDEQDLLLLIVEDITSSIQTRVELRESEERYRITFGQAGVGLAHVDHDGRWLQVNRKLQDIVGYSEQELLGSRYQDITHPDDLDLDDNLELLPSFLSGEINEYSSEKRYIHKAGHHVWVHITCGLMHGSAGKIDFVVVIKDISQRKRVEGELMRLANHDSLTGLPNRTLLQDRLSQAITYANRAGRYVAVLFIDLDRFKNINDSLGHEAGDAVIAEVGRRLSENVRDGDTVARLGGDEFVVVLVDVAREDEVAAIAKKILGALFRRMMLQGQELSPVGSIGISLYPKDGQDSQTLLKNADAAMYRAKDAGSNNFQFYAHEMNARTLDRLKLEGGLRRALELEEFFLHYQPKVDIHSGAIVGVEALLRWQPAGKAMIQPSDFIPIAEETGLIVQIGEWVLRTACAQHRAWTAAGCRAVRIAVNLSTRQFKQQALEKMVAQVLEETGCSAKCLELEITESVLMENPELAAQTLKDLSNMGVHLSIDDFGTGYSSLSYLKRFPIDTLKIDRSFVRDITTDADDAAIAKAVIALAHSMKLKVIAEGVETVEQLNFLREHGCDQMQGYYFSKPLPPDQLQRLLALD